MEHLKLILSELLIILTCSFAAVRADEINYPEEDTANSWLVIALVAAVVIITAVIIYYLYERRKRK